MMTTSLPSRFMMGLFGTALVLATLTGCQTVVQGGGGGDGGAGGDTSTGTDTGTTSGTGDPPPDCGDFAPCPTPAFAMSHEQLVTVTGEDTEGGLLTDTQYLFFGDGAQAPSCAVPYGGSGCGGWNVAISMPTTSLVTGASYPLTDPTIQTFIQETFGEGGNSCAASGSIDFGEGQIVINEATDVLVQFTVTGLPIDSITNNNMNGTYVASRCP